MQAGTPCKHGFKQLAGKMLASISVCCGGLAHLQVVQGLRPHRALAEPALVHGFHANVQLAPLCSIHIATTTCIARKTTEGNCTKGAVYYRECACVFAELAQTKTNCDTFCKLVTTQL
jgi:hypothetical protein